MSRCFFSPTSFQLATWLPSSATFRGGETIADLGLRPGGAICHQKRFLLGAERVIAIDTVPERLGLAKSPAQRHSIS